MKFDDVEGSPGGQKSTSEGDQRCGHGQRWPHQLLLQEPRFLGLAAGLGLFLALGDLAGELLQLLPTGHEVQVGRNESTGATPADIQRLMVVVVKSVLLLLLLLKMAQTVRTAPSGGRLRGR